VDCSSTCFFVATSQAMRSMSSGVGSVAFSRGHMAVAVSQTSFSTVRQFGWNFRLGKFSESQWQADSMPSSSKTFCLANSQTNFSMSSGVGTWR